MLVGVGGEAKKYVHVVFLFSLLGFKVSSAESNMPGTCFVVSCRAYVVELRLNDTALIVYIVSILKCSSNTSLTFCKTVFYINM